jgi:hypothetical protein
MRKSILTCAFTLLMLSSLACTASLLATPTAAPTPVPASPTPAVASPTAALPTVVTPSPGVATATSPLPTNTSTSTPGSPSGPYAVVLVQPGDVLYIRSAAGAGNPSVGSFAPTANNIMRTGSSAMAGGDLWVQVVNPTGGTGWVNSHFLTEYLPPASFCADGRVNTLITSLDSALTGGNGELLANLTSPTHGADVRLWRFGNAINFDREHIRWVFESTYPHNWGAAPASGMDTTGSFQEAVLPKLQDVFNASYSLTCDSLGTAPQYGSNPWPVEYADVNYYTAFKAGTPGVDLDWRYWLVGVEFVQGQPYLFALIHFNWEP